MASIFIKTPVLDKSFSKMDTIFHKIFVLFGTNLTQINLNRKFLHLTVYLMNFLACCYILGFQKIHQNFLYQQKSMVSVVADMLQTLIPTLCHLLVLLQTFIQRIAHRKLNSMVLKLIDDLVDLKSEYNSKVVGESLLNHFVALNMVCLASEIIPLYLVEAINWSLTIRLKTIALIVIRLNDFQFIFYVLQINEVLEKINQELWQKHRNLSAIRKILNHVWKTVEFLNQRFGFSLLCTVIANFIVCLMSSYWIMYNIYYDRFETWTYMLSSTSFIVSPIVNLIILFKVCSSFVNKVKD